jgi:hypothetical protein
LWDFPFEPLRALRQPVLATGPVRKRIIARTEAVPYVTAQPIARYWYAEMLAERGGPGDIEAAKALLQASITGSDAIGLVLYARLARRRFAQFA